MYTQSTAKEMHMLLILAHAELTARGEKILSNRIDAYLDSLEPAERKTDTPQEQPNQPTSTHITSAEYAAIHAVNKLVKRGK